MHTEPLFRFHTLAIKAASSHTAAETQSNTIIENNDNKAGSVFFAECLTQEIHFHSHDFLLGSRTPASHLLWHPFPSTTLKDPSQPATTYTNTVWARVNEHADIS